MSINIFNNTGEKHIIHFMDLSVVFFNGNILKILFLNFDNFDNFDEKKSKLIKCCFTQVFLKSSEIFWNESFSNTNYNKIYQHKFYNVCHLN